ncbi:hypothetical protein Tco_0687255 [Tanacetum coccineum]
MTGGMVGLRSVPSSTSALTAHRMRSVGFKEKLDEADKWSRDSLRGVSDRGFCSQMIYGRGGDHEVKDYRWYRGRSSLLSQEHEALGCIVMAARSLTISREVRGLYRDYVLWYNSNDIGILAWTRRLFRCCGGVLGYEEQEHTERRLWGRGVWGCDRGFLWVLKRRDVTAVNRNDIIWLMASMGSSPCLNTRTVRLESSWGNLEVLMIDWLSIVETDKMIHTMETDIVKLMVEIENFGMSFYEFNKETVSVDELQLRQADLNCIYALNKLHLHEIRVVLSKHEADQCHMSGPFSTDSRIIHPCCLFIMYSSILLFQESYISFSNIGGRLSAPERITLSARVVIEKFHFHVPNTYIPQESDSPPYDTLRINTYFPDTFQTQLKKPRLRDNSFEEWVKIKLGHTNISEIIKCEMFKEWVKENFNFEGDFKITRDDPYSRRFDEYKEKFDIKIEQLANEYDLRVGRKKYALDDIWEKCEKFQDTAYQWHDEGFEEDEQ